MSAEDGLQAAMGDLIVVEGTLNQAVARTSDDSVKTDKELTCEVCGEVVCDIEDGDTLYVLALTMLTHFEEAGH